MNANMTMTEYLALPAVSSGVVIAAARDCPYAAYWESYLNPVRMREHSKVTDSGTIAHSLFLEGDESNLVVVDAADWRTKAAQDAGDAAYASNKTPILAKKLAPVRLQVQRANEFMQSIKNTEPAVYDCYNTGDTETVHEWDDDGVPCRIRPDRISIDKRMILDYKTTAASPNPESWGRTQMIGMGFYISAAFYRRGIKALYGVDADYVFLVQQNTAPYLCSLVGLGPREYELGEQQVERGLRTWRACVTRKSFPAYPARVVYPELPAWEAARVEEAELNAAYDELQAEKGLQP